MRKTILILTVLVAIFACESDTDVSGFNLEQLRREFINEIEVQYTNTFIQSINGLNSKINDFIENPSEEKLSSLKDSWKASANAFSSIEIMNIGEVKKSLIISSFFSWGANETAINDYITSSNTISNEIINTKPTNMRGLSAVEYLLFEKLPSETITDFSSTRRKDYLRALGENLVEKASILNTNWSNYRSSFVSNNKTGINGGLNMLVNQMNGLLEDVRRFKIGEPAGLERTTTPDASMLQAEKSGYSLTLINENIKSIEKIYFSTKNSIDNYVFYLTKSEDINTKVREQFSMIDEDFISLKGVTLKDVITTKPTEVKKLYDDIKDLIVLIKIDVASALSVTITFTDNDGD